MRNVLITGGSEGIGLAVARLLAAEKDTRVTLVARNEAKLRETGHDYIVADLSQPEGVELVARRLGCDSLRRPHQQCGRRPVRPLRRAVFSQSASLGTA